MNFLRNLFGKKQPDVAPSSSEPTKPTPRTSQSKQVQAILVLTLRPLYNAQTVTVVQQICDQQRAKGHSFAPNFGASARVGFLFDDDDYIHVKIRTEFSQLVGHDLMERTKRFPFQASDGNSGYYYIVFDRP